jgi:hypothetical protein
MVKALGSYQDPALGTLSRSRTFHYGNCTDFFFPQAVKETAGEAYAAFFQIGDEELYEGLCAGTNRIRIATSTRDEYL